MTFKSKLGDKFSRDEKYNLKNKGFSLIPTKSQLTGKADKLVHFRDRYMISIAKKLYCEGKLPLDEETFVNTITNVESMHFLREMTWIYQFITREPSRKWNAIPIGFQIFELGLETSPDKSEPMDYKELLKKFTYGLTTVGPYFTMEEKKNYLESTGKKLSFLCPIFALAMVDSLINEVPRKELNWFFDLIGVKVMNFLKHKNFVPKKKFESKKEASVPKVKSSKKEKKWFVNKFDKEKAEAEANAEVEQVDLIQTEAIEEVEVPETKVEQQSVENAIDGDEVHYDAEGQEVHYAPTEAELTAEKEALEVATTETAEAETSKESPNE